MICIRFSILSKWAERKRIAFTTYTDLAARPEVLAPVFGPHLCYVATSAGRTLVVPWPASEETSGGNR